MHKEDEDMEIGDFNSGSEDELDIICNMIYVLPIEFIQVTKVIEEDDSGLAEELANQKPLCYYMVNNGLIDEDKATFEWPDYNM